MMTSYQEFHSPDRQRGITLITVMLILIVITLLGVSAMRMSLSSLTLATNSQVSNLLFQSADTGLTQMIDTVALTPGRADEAGGVLIDAITNKGTEFTFCVTPVNTALSQFTPGNCDVNNTSQYMSGRNVVATQVSVMRAELDQNWHNSDAQLAEVAQPYRMVVYSTAVIPAFGSADKDAINDCLRLPNDDSTDDPVAGTDTISVTDCLADSGAVFNTQVDEGLYGFQ